MSHWYLECPNTLSVSALVNKVKANSSRWIHETFPESHDFAWQRGFGVFSVDCRKDEKLKQYICDQKAHHAKVSFETEYLQLLRAHGIQYDRRIALD